MRLTLSFGLVLCAASTFAAPQNYQQTTPVPILKQINRHNDDGSYSYGYEGADGTFKIETKYPNGEVHGKYGYIGDDGKLREVEYGASKRGFEPSGSDIQVAPPTLSNSIEERNTDYDDGQYREDPSVYYKQTANTKSVFSGTRFPASTAPVYQNPQPQYYQTQYNQPQAQYTQPQYTPQYTQPQYTSQYTQPQYTSQYSQSQPRYSQLAQYNQPQYQYQYQAQPQFRPQPQYNFNSQAQYQFTYDPAIFNGHPATNFDINTGSYTVSYNG